MKKLFILMMIVAFFLSSGVVHAASQKPKPKLQKNESGQKSSRSKRPIKKVAAKKETPVVKTGKASWYGKRFHGKKTASGEPYNMYDNIAAHKTIPLGSVIQVWNVENGLSTVVKITDRGPFIQGRILDLSLAAWKKLGGGDKGTIKIAFEFVEH